MAQANNSDRFIAAYVRLQKHIDTFQGIPLLTFDERASNEFQRLRQAGIRIGTMDLRIAAIALANNATVLTRNLSDFQRIPGLKCEDWSV